MQHFGPHLSVIQIQSYVILRMFLQLPHFLKNKQPIPNVCQLYLSTTIHTLQYKTLFENQLAKYLWILTSAFITINTFRFLHCAVSTMTRLKNRKMKINELHC